MTKKIIDVNPSTYSAHPPITCTGAYHNILYEELKSTQPETR
jgi:hypothetical protein